MIITKKEKKILEELVKNSEGLLSPATFISSIAKHDKRAVENLVIMGYVEEVPQHKPGLTPGSTYVLNFYRATQKGIMLFAPLHKRAWFEFKNNVALYIGIISIVCSTITIILYFNTLDISREEVERANKEFQLRMRPYLVVDSIDADFNEDNKSAKYTMHIKNVGTLPAKIVEKSVFCVDVNGQQTPAGKIVPDKTAVIGSNQTILDHLSISVEKAKCQYVFKYKNAINEFSNMNYKTLYTISFVFGVSPGMEDAELQ